MKNHATVPSFTKGAKALVSLMESHGYALDRVNSKGAVFFTHPTLPEQRINPRMTDVAAGHETRRFQRLVGAPTKRDQSKRDVAAVKDRQSREREQAAKEHARLEKQRDGLVAEREAFASRFGVETTAEARAIAAQIERTEREMRYWASLMTETPTSGHKGVEHAKHRA